MTCWPAAAVARRCAAAAACWYHSSIAASVTSGCPADTSAKSAARSYRCPHLAPIHTAKLGSIGVNVITAGPVLARSKPTVAANPANSPSLSVPLPRAAQSVLPACLVWRIAIKPYAGASAHGVAARGCARRRRCCPRPESPSRGRTCPPRPRPRRRPATSCGPPVAGRGRTSRPVGFDARHSKSFRSWAVGTLHYWSTVTDFDTCHAKLFRSVWHRAVRRALLREELPDDAVQALRDVERRRLLRRPLRFARRLRRARCVRGGRVPACARHRAMCETRRASRIIETVMQLVMQHNASLETRARGRCRPGRGASRPWP
jgi:hypothetical protein